MTAFALPALACGAPGSPEGANPFGSAGSSDDDDGAATTESTSGAADGSTSTGPATTMPAVDEGDESSTAAVDDGSTGGATQATETSAGGSSDTGSSSGSGSDTSNDGTVEVDVELMNMWETGECDDVTVTNVSAAPVMWEVELDLPGVVYQLWNAEMTEMNGIGTFVGVDFNGTIDPGAQAMFGFCVNY